MASYSQSNQQIIKPFNAQVPRILNPIVAVIESIPRFVFYIVVCFWFRSPFADFLAMINYQ